METPLQLEQVKAAIHLLVVYTYLQEVGPFGRNKLLYKQQVYWVQVQIVEVPYRFRQTGTLLQQVVVMITQV
jgi:ABC-type tungstate transport system substrate-binding protein